MSVEYIVHTNIDNQQLNVNNMSFYSGSEGCLDRDNNSLQRQ